ERGSIVPRSILSVVRISDNTVRLKIHDLTSIRFITSASALRIPVDSRTHAWDIRPNKDLYLSSERARWPADIQACVTDAPPPPLQICSEVKTLPLTLLIVLTSCQKGDGPLHVQLEADFGVITATEP